MNETERITQWVEYKIGKLLTDDIEKEIRSESSTFDVDKYSQMMFETHFSNESGISDDSLKLNFESDEFDLTDAFSSDDDQYDFQQPSLDKIIRELQSESEDAKIKALESMEACSAEMLVVQSSWTIARKILQDILRSSEERLSNQLLEVFRRFLLSNEVPKVVCEGFVTLAESVSSQIESINASRISESPRELYDFKQNKWMYGKISGAIEVIFKSIWLLVQSQKGIPLKWSRFNEKRLREIVFSFIQMLSSTKSLKNNERVCGLEILSVLDPKATWCSNWCHGATGRSLLYSVLKTHKKFFAEIVDFLLIWIKDGESSTTDKIKSVTKIKLPPITDRQEIRSKSENLNTFNISKHSSRSLKGNRSAPPFPADEKIHHQKEKISSDRMLKRIPKEVANEAKFCHCLSMIVYIIQYQGGRSLFPLEVASRRRRITVLDLSETIINYINGRMFFSARNPLTTDDYQEHMLKLIEILKSSIKKE
ncbi:UNVERIFIED_CONTAM: hypothetical protein PYX00_005593 [Menopon gallinae]|uniref:BROMI middle region domain-containing protein n=1 Tax=Menopon gallinae TaxID=328185 RepID=A0AAW2HSG0_9NEOP